MSQRDWLWLTFCGVQIRCQKLFWRVRSVFLICHCVSHHSSYSFSFVLRNNIVAIYILHRLVYSARLFMKMASLGFVFWCMSLQGSLVVVLKRQSMVVRAVAEPDLLWGALHLVGMLLALLLVLPRKFRQVCSINMLYFGKCATMDMNSLFQVQRVMVYVCPRLAKCQRRLK